MMKTRILLLFAMFALERLLSGAIVGVTGLNFVDAQGNPVPNGNQVWAGNFSGSSADASSLPSLFKV